MIDVGDIRGYLDKKQQDEAIVRSFRGKISKDELAHVLCDDKQRTVIYRMSKHLQLQEDIKKPESIAKHYFYWAKQGFPDAKKHIREIRNIQSILLSWTFPPKLKQSRNSESMWSLLCSLSAIQGLAHIHLKERSRRYLRVITRGMGKHV